MRGGIASIADLRPETRRRCCRPAARRKRRRRRRAAAPPRRAGAQGSRCGTRVRGRSPPTPCEPLGHALLVLAPQRLGESRRRCPLGRSVCTETGVCSSLLARSMRRSISSGRRLPEEAQRIERRQRGEGEAAADHADAAMSGISRKMPSQDRLTNRLTTSRSGSTQRPEPLDDHRRAGRQPRPRQAVRNVRGCL